jgi:hypothetical protein
MQPGDPSLAPPSDDQIDEEYRFVADSHTAAAAARATVSYAVTKPAFWRFLGILMAVEAFVVAQGVRGAHVSLATRLFWGFFVGSVPTVIVGVICLSIGYVRTLRNARTRLGAGMVLRSGFGPHYFVVAGSLGTGMTAYAAVRGVVVRGDFVWLRVVGRSAAAYAPRALFPDSAIARMRQAKAS